MIDLALAHTQAIQQQDNLWTAWSFDPSLLIIAWLSYVYFAGLKKYRRKQKHFYATWRIVCFSSGFLTLIIALASPLDHLSSEYFAAHMVQHILIVMLAAPLFLLGLPTYPIISGTQKHFPKTVITLLHFKPYRTLFTFCTKPLIAIIIYLAIFWGWHLPWLYNLALTSELAHYLQHFLFFASGLLIWYSLVDPRGRNFFYLLRLLWILLLTFANSILSALLVFTPEPYYKYFDTAQNSVFDSLNDQKIGGLIMWLVGNMMFLLALVIIFFSIF